MKSAACCIVSLLVICICTGHSEVDVWYWHWRDDIEGVTLQAFTLTLDDRESRKSTSVRDFFWFGVRKDWLGPGE